MSPKHRLFTCLAATVGFFVLAAPALAAGLNTAGHQTAGVPTALVVPVALLATWATLLFRSRGPFD